MKTKRKSRRVPVICRGIVPAQNALKYAAHTLRHIQHRAQKDAMALEYAMQPKEDVSALRLQADDLRQVAQFLEERILP